MANLTYLGPEWAEEAQKRLKEELTPEKLHHVTSSMANIYKNCPDGRGRYFFVEFTDGEVSRFEIGEGDPPKAEFKIIADYDTFAKISKGSSARSRHSHRASSPCADTWRKPCAWRPWWTSSTGCSPLSRPTTDTGDDPHDS